jgi:cell division transport system permease protein
MSVGMAGSDQLAALFGTFSLSLGGYIAIVAQMVLMAVVTAIASRRTVNRTLEFVD